MLLYAFFTFPASMYLQGLSLQLLMSFCSSIPGLPHAHQVKPVHSDEFEQCPPFSGDLCSVTLHLIFDYLPLSGPECTCHSPFPGAVL